VKGETRYALVQYGDTVAGSLLLVELSEAVSLDKAVITVDEVLENFKQRSLLNDYNNAAFRNGAVRNVGNE